MSENLNDVKKLIEMLIIGSALHTFNIGIGFEDGMRINLAYVKMNRLHCHLRDYYPSS